MSTSGMALHGFTFAGGTVRRLDGLEIRLAPYGA
jgi:hypothetical protein